MEFKEKVVFITGGNSGIGKATAFAFAREGAKVIIGARREQEGEKVVEEIKKNGGEAIFIRTDISQEQNIKNAIQEIVKLYGRLDCAFNNAGILPMYKPLHEVSVSEYDDVMNINLRGMFLCMKYELSQMVSQGNGAIVNMSSVNGLGGSAFVSGIYTTAKHAIIGLTRNAALEYARLGIRINVVCPGAVPTPMLDVFPSEIIAGISQAHPLGRAATVEEVANAVLWLCSDKSSFTTGHALAVDGGLLAM